MFLEHQMRKHFTDNLSRHPLYRTWAAMKDRCTNKNHRNFDIYGGNGVRVCDRWMRFKNFLEDMGEKPSPRHTLDRIDSKGDYEPTNCRWADSFVQGQNTSRVKRIEINGETKCLNEWCRHYQLNRATVKSRVRAGRSIEDALTTPVQQDGRTRRHAKR